MNVALVTEFSASRKEPLAAVLERVHGAFLSSGLGEPALQFVFADAPVAGFTSSVERVLKRQPQLAGFVSNAPGMPGGPPVRMISNGSAFPRSFPLHNVVVHFQSPAFGTTTGVSHPLFAMPPGLVVSDSWWVSGRNRSVRAVTCVNADAASRQLPPPSSEVALVLEACGKPRKTVQIPLGEAPAAENLRPAQAPPETLKAVGELVLDYRARLAEIVDRANLPHDLPPALEAMQVVALGDVTGPKKPVLVHAFKPRGYGCRGESGTFALRRRTAGNLTVEVFLDVGTWSRSVTAFLTVTGLGFGARLPLPVAKRAIAAGQSSIGNAQRWQKIVDNLAALVAELDKTFVPAIEAISGPVPEWYKPET